MPRIFNSFEFLEVMSWRCPSEVLSPPTVTSHREKTDRKHHKDDHSKFAENSLLQTEENEEKHVYDGVEHVDENEQVL